MIHSNTIQVGEEYRCQEAINLYKSSACESLVTQAAARRHLRFLDYPSLSDKSAVRVCLCEDDYPGWLALSDLHRIVIASASYRPPHVDADAIQRSVPDVVYFLRNAMNRPNEYLWGGTVGPDYDCSGLMQTAFASVGIVLPRDSYQQEAFTQPIALPKLQVGDLVFFGTGDRTTHVGFYLGDGQYIHSSGKEHGRNGIGIDSLRDLADPVSYAYHQQFRRGGRILCSYCPTGASIVQQTTLQTSAE
jgi:cell wall-associated NlpC family hydrolase